MSVLAVTGGASGLGRAVALAAAGRGWSVALLDRDSAAVVATAAEAGLLAVPADVTRPGELAEAFATVAGELGPIDGLVNSAGLTRPGPAELMAEADWRLVIDVDLSGTFYACQAAFDHLAPDASIVNLASIAATRGLPGRAAYSAAKAGVVGLTRALAAEWADRGIRVNAIGPAWADTRLIRDMVAQGAIQLEEMVSRVPLGRLCGEDDVARTALFLLSREAAGYITGQTIYVDGGYLWAG